MVHDGRVQEAAVWLPHANGQDLGRAQVHRGRQGGDLPHRAIAKILQTAVHPQRCRREKEGDGTRSHQVLDRDRLHVGPSSRAAPGCRFAVFASLAKSPVHPAGVARRGHGQGLDGALRQGTIDGRQINDVMQGVDQGHAVQCCPMLARRERHTQGGGPAAPAAPFAQGGTGQLVDLWRA